MKKILAISLVAIMSVGAARAADIASTDYVKSKTGDLNSLTTNNKSNLVGAVNEINASIGIVNGDGTYADSPDSLGYRIESLESEIETLSGGVGSVGTQIESVTGKLSELQTTTKGSLVDAVNELDTEIEGTLGADGKRTGGLKDQVQKNTDAIGSWDSAESAGTGLLGTIGDMGMLYTPEMGTLVEAINSTYDEATTNTTNVGIMKNLKTTEKTTLVGAVNELETDKIDKSQLGMQTPDGKLFVIPDECFGAGVTCAFVVADGNAGWQRVVDSEEQIVGGVLTKYE